MAIDKPETSRSALLQQVQQVSRWDAVIMGGGATGLGIALQAAVQGYRVLLLEAEDFASGTSSRSTKLLHGGVRYLAQGHLGLVRDALNERQTVIRNAPFLARSLTFALPSYCLRDSWKYRIGLRVYDWLSGATSLGQTGWVEAEQARKMLPELRSDGLKGLVTYCDGQFDDAGLAIALARTANRQGAMVLNHCAVKSVKLEQGQVKGVQWVDTLDGSSHIAHSNCVINATGVWLDRLRASRMPRSVTVSRGTHVVVDRSFWPHDHGLIIPDTSDGRVLFVLPWQGYVLLGTTDIPCTEVTSNPRPDSAEIHFILHEVSRYLTRPPQVADVTSVWAGLRSLVTPMGAKTTLTRNIGREHAIWQDLDGQVCVAGGKWTTYRLMAEQVVTFCRQAGLLDASKPLTSTRHLALDCPLPSDWESGPISTHNLTSTISESYIRWCVRNTQACTVEDMLARRYRWLMLDARRAHAVAEDVAKIMHSEGLSDVRLDHFLAMTDEYLPRVG